MGQRVEFDVDASRSIAEMTAMGTRAKSFTNVFSWARERLALSNAANFASNGLPSGNAWDPLDPEYGAWKSRHFPGAPPMVRTGKLFKSLTSLRGAGNVITPQMAEFGTTVRYAKFHQDGTRHMPKRQIVFEPPLFARELGDKVARWVNDGDVI